MADFGSFRSMYSSFILPLSSLPCVVSWWLIVSFRLSSSSFRCHNTPSCRCVCPKRTLLSRTNRKSVRPRSRRSAKGRQARGLRQAPAEKNHDRQRSNAICAPPGWPRQLACRGRAATRGAWVTSHLPLAPHGAPTSELSGPPADSPAQILHSPELATQPS